MVQQRSNYGYEFRANNLEQIQSESIMNFVGDALTKIKPLLEKYLIGSNCKLITIGYEMRGWEPAWAESILGLTIHMYDMRDLDMLYNSLSQFDLMDLGAPSAQNGEVNILSKKDYVGECQSQCSDARRGSRTPNYNYSSSKPAVNTGVVLSSAAGKSIEVTEKRIARASALSQDEDLQT